MRVLGIDYGEKTIGAAVSCENARIAFELETVRRENGAALKKSLGRLKELTRLYNVGEIVLGLPLRLNGEMGERAQKTLAFKEKLEKYIKRVKIILWDERFSTREAYGNLIETGADTQNVDAAAARIILQSYLDYKNADSK